MPKTLVYDPSKNCVLKQNCLVIKRQLWET